MKKSTHLLSTQKNRAAGLFALLFLFAHPLFSQVVTVTSAINNTYTNLRFALNAINSGSGSGAVTVTINADHAITTTKCTLNQTNYTVTITANGDRTVSTALADDLLLLNGADNVTIQSGGAGNSLTFTNSSTGTAATCITLNSSANNNTLNGLTLIGSTQGQFSNGVLNVRGNSDGNKIQNCKITGPSSARPRNCIVLEGSSTAATNDNTEISGCEISRFYVPGSYGEGVFSYRYNRGTMITGNHFFQPEATTVSVSGSVFRPIEIQDGSTDPAATVTISGNFIGGSAPNCGGAAWTMTSSNNLYLTQGMWVQSGTNTGTGASIQGNTIQNFDLTCTYAETHNQDFFNGIFMSVGRASIGTTTENTIGSNVGQGAIHVFVNFNVNYTVFVNGIVNLTPVAVAIANNKIGSWTIDRNTTGNGILFFEGIVSHDSDLCTMTGNYIGSPSTANSITTNFSNDKIEIRGIACTGGSYTVSNNTVKNLTNNAGWAIGGIICYTGATSGKTFTCQNNTVSTLTAGDGLDNDIYGILCLADDNTTYTAQISGNTVTNILAAAATDDGTELVGIGIGQSNQNVRASGYCNNNTVTNLTLLTPVGYTFVIGITLRSQFNGDFAVNQNTVSNMVSTSLYTYGMRVSDEQTTSTGTVTFSQNTISNLECIYPGGANFPMGLSLRAKNVVASRNKIFSIRATNAPAGSEIRGIQVFGDATAYCSLPNNLISLGANQPTTCDIYGVTNNELNPISDLDLYYNTICIAGSGGGSSAAFDRRVTSNVSTSIRNNIFYNARPGGLAVSNTASPPATGWASGASNKNYFVSPTASSLTKWGSIFYDMAGWRYASGGDMASVTRTIGPLGNETLPEELFVNHPAGDLSFITANNNECAVVQNIGEVVAGITVDFFGNVRTATPDIGGFEFATVLPLEWVGFRAFALENANRLVWKTVGESGVSHFDIERSADGLLFEKIGEVAATGGSIEKEYGFDDDRFWAKGWYRIRSVDFDGRPQVSPVQFLARPETGHQPPVIFPNPVADGAATLSFFSEMEGEVLLETCSASGQCMRSEKVFVEKGQNFLPLDFLGLPTGVFRVVVFKKTGVMAVRIVRI